MPALSFNSHAPWITATQRIPADESARRAPSPGNSDWEALAKLVDTLQEAALNPISMKHLGVLILDTESAPCGKSLATLMHPSSEPGADMVREACCDLPHATGKRAESSSHPSEQTVRLAVNSQPGNPPPAHRLDADTRFDSALRERTAAIDVALEVAREARMRITAALWERHVSYITMEADEAELKLKEKHTEPSPSRSLLEFAVDYRTEHPDETASNFFRPFYQLARRGIEIPDDIALVFKRDILPFDAFRTMVDTYVTQLPMQTPAQLHSVSDTNIPKGALYWEHALAALCSPLSTVCLDRGTIRPETLLDWTGLKKRLEALGLGPEAQRNAKRRNKLPPPSETSRPITVLLAKWHLFNGSEFDRSITSNAALLKNPEKLRALADNLVSRAHIEYFLAIAGSVDESVLEREMDRVAKLHEPLKAGISPAERSFFYDGSFRLPPVEKSAFLLESCAIMAPYLLVNALRTDERLDMWTVVKAADGDRNTQARIERRPARALFDNWVSLGIPVEHQAWMARFMLQGFDETWAKNVVQAHANDFSRVQAWFTHASDAGDADLDFRLDRTMKAAVARWLADKNISPEALKLVPAMIRSDISAERIDQVLDFESSAFLYQIYGIFGAGTHTPQKIRYGLVALAQLLERILEGKVFDDQLRQVEEQELHDVSEWRKKAANTRDCLRRKLHAIEALRDGMTARTPQADQSECLADALKDAILLLDFLLQPGMETRWAQESRDIKDKLTVLAADLGFRITNLADRNGIGMAGLKQFA